MKRGLNFILIVFCIFSIFLIAEISAASDLLLSNSTWTVTDSMGGNIDHYDFPVRSHDNNFLTYTDLVEDYIVSGAYSLATMYVEYTLPQPVAIGKINYSYLSIYFSKYPYSTDYHPLIKVELFIGGVWMNISSNCAVVEYREDNPIGYFNPRINWPHYIESCNGTWNNVQKIKISFSGYGAGEYGGFIPLIETQAFAPLVAPCTPNCSGKECGDNGCSGICGNCDNLYPGQGKVCQSGTCIIPTICTDNDTILKLSVASNAHGALWNDARYTTNICCSNIFGAASPECTSAAGAVHTCNGNNHVLVLSSDTDAHANIICAKSPDLDNDGIVTLGEQTALTNCIYFSIGCNPTYDLNNDGAYTIIGDAPCIPLVMDSRMVCYRNLRCQKVDDPAACPAGYQTVARLLQDADSHLSNSSDLTYPVKICCKDGGPLPAGNVYWMFLNGSRTTTAEIGDSVLMIYENRAGSSFVFNIKEDDIVFDDDIKNISTPFNRGADLAALWTITQEDYNKGNNVGEGNEEELFFEVNGITSNILIVQKDSFDNAKPVARIIKPEPETNYTINTGTGLTDALAFEQISIDPDDDLKAIWTFGDGNDSGWLLNCLTTGNCNTTHQYNSFGTKTIRLRAEEISRSLWDDDSSRIYIYREGINVFAIIDNPKYNETVEGRAVYINANRSKAINCSFDSVQCNAAAAPLSCYPVVDAINLNTVYCYELQGKGVNYDLIFEWTFDGTIQKTGSWTPATYSEYVEFVQGFADVGRHSIKLRVGYNPH